MTNAHFAGSRAGCSSSAATWSSGRPAEAATSLKPDAELRKLGLSPREVALDGGFNTGPTNETLTEIAPEPIFISGRQQPGSRRTQRRMQRYRTGSEGRISHLKRGYGLRRSRLKGDQGQQIWTGWAHQRPRSDRRGLHGAQQPPLPGLVQHGDRERTQ